MEFRLHGGSCVLFGPWHDALLFVLFLYTSHSIVLFKRYNIAAAYFDSSGNRFPVERPGVSLDTAAVLFISIGDVTQSGHCVASLDQENL